MMYPFQPVTSTPISIGGTKAMTKQAPVVYGEEAVGYGSVDLHVATIPVWLAAWRSAISTTASG